MTALRLSEEMKLKIYTDKDTAEKRQICGCFVGDLLSLAMSKVEADNAWVTIQTNVNVVAVASLTDCGCVIIAEGFCPDEDAVRAANERGVVILGGEISAYETVKRLVELGI